MTTKTEKSQEDYRKRIEKLGTLLGVAILEKHLQISIRKAFPKLKALGEDSYYVVQNIVDDASKNANLEIINE